MPTLSEEAAKALLASFKNMKPLALDISEAEEESALRRCNQYLDGETRDISNFPPLSIYYILSKLPKLDQIAFIKNNIEYLQKNDEDVFLYDLHEPKELAYYLSYEALETIYKLDKRLFEKVIQGTPEYVFHGFTHEDYISYFDTFHSNIMNMQSWQLFRILDEHNRYMFDNIDIDKVNFVLESQYRYNEEFITYFIKNYQEKIDTFTPIELLRFISYIENVEEYKKIVFKNEEKIKIAFQKIAENDFFNYFHEEVKSWQQEILFSNFLEIILRKQDIKTIIIAISSNVIFELWNKNKKIFDKMTLEDWIRAFAKKREFNENHQMILDDYPIYNISKFFDIDFYSNQWESPSIKPLQYIETKYRNGIDKNDFISTNQITSIFSKEYFHNLKYLQKGLKEKVLSKDSKKYQENLMLFITYLQSNHIVKDLDNLTLKEIDYLFYKIIRGYPIASVLKITSIEQIAEINRLGKKIFNPSDFTVEQIEKFNVREYRQLLSIYQKKEKTILENTLLLKLLLLVGFQNTKRIIEIDGSISTLEHLVGNVDVKHVILDDRKHSILNSKILNLLFSNPTQLEKVLINKENEIYKYFPRIFNEWEAIQGNDKDKSLASVIDFLKSAELVLPPNYYRLNGLFKLIGCENRIVKETLELHDEMLTRTTSTIPKIKKQLGEYTYEVLDLQDMNGLTVGNETDCCFTVLGASYSSLKHATTSKNGRILVVKRNDRLLAHSWIWRNGNVLCLDNIEVSKTIHEVDFLDVYLDFAETVIKKSFEQEGIDTCLKNVTIGYTNFDKNIIGLQDFPCFISKTCNLEEKEFGKKLGNHRKMVSELPKPIEEVNYSDAKNAQYLIKGNGSFDFYQSNVYYRDSRNEVMIYEKENEYSYEYIEKMNQIINALRYTQCVLNNDIDSFEYINIKNDESVICNVDWFIRKNGDDVDSFIYSNDHRVYEEIEAYSKESQKCKRMSL